jgi:hypothetical protein
VCLGISRLLFNPQESMIAQIWDPIPELWVKIVSLYRGKYIVIVNIHDCDYNVHVDVVYMYMVESFVIVVT